MSSFDSLFGPAQDVLYSTFGTSCTYNGTAITCEVNGYDLKEDQYPEVWIASAIIEVRSSEVSAPIRGDTVILNGITYQVGEVLNRDDLGATLALTKQMVRI